MFTYVKSLIVVLSGILLVMILARRPLMPLFGGATRWGQRFGVLIAITSASFLAKDFWVFCLIAAIVLWQQQVREDNIPALYFFLIAAVPPMSRGVPGFGLFNYVVDITYPKLLSLVVLAPLALRIYRKNSEANSAFGRADGWVLAYFLLHQALYFNFLSVTALLREAVDFFINIWLPYYVMSRFFKDEGEIREALVGIVLASVIASVLAIPEYIKHWSFYVTVRDALNVPEWFALNLTRGGGYRAQGATGQPIILGFLIAIALAVWFCIGRYCESRICRWGITLVLILGLLATISRGPWMGALFGLGICAVLAPSRGRRLLLWGSAVGVVVVIALLSPAGGAIAKYLPFVSGGVEEGNVVYRQQLLQTSIAILSQYPWFGTPFFMGYMEHLRQGQGIIDIVNTYMVVALPTGYIGLIVWVTPMFLALWMEFSRYRASISSGNVVSAYLSASLMAALGCSMLIIATVSPIGIVGYLLWSVVGILARVDGWVEYP